MTVKKLIGSDPSQISRNRDLGSLAFQNTQNAKIENLGGSLSHQIGIGGYTRPKTSPSLIADFVGTKRIHPRMKFNRLSRAYYYDDTNPTIVAQNLIVFSQDLSKGNWEAGNDNWRWFKTGINNFGSGSTADATTAPDGTVTADLVTEDTSTGQHVIGQSILAFENSWHVEDTYCASAYVKNASGSRFLRFELMFASSYEFAYMAINPADGTIVNKPDRRSNYRSDLLDGGVTSVGSGWYRIWLTIRGRPERIRFHLMDGRFPTTLDAIAGQPGVSYTGNGTSGVYIWGVQIERLDTGNPAKILSNSNNYPGPTPWARPRSYVPTTEQPVTIRQKFLTLADFHEPRFDHDPITRECKGLLLEGHKILFFRSTENFNHSTWTKTNVSFISPYTSPLNIYGTIPNPNGTYTPNFMSENSVNAAHAVSCTVTTLYENYIYTMSCYAKAKERNWLRFDLSLAQSSTYNVWFDLTNGKVGAEIRATSTAALSLYSRSEIIDVGNGWYRCTFRFRNTGGGSGGTGTFSIGMATGNGNTTYSGNGTSGLYIWGPQLEVNQNNHWSSISPMASSYAESRHRQVTWYGDWLVLPVKPLYDPGMPSTNHADYQSNWFNQFEGTAYVDLKAVTYSAGSMIRLSSSDNPSYFGSTDRQQLYVYRPSDVSLYGVFSSPFSYSGYADRTSVDGIYGKRHYHSSINFSKTTKLAMAYKFGESTERQAGMSWTVNGDPVSRTYKAQSHFPWHYFIIGQRIDDYWNNYNGWVRRFAYFPRRLGDDELRGLTWTDIDKEQ